MRRMRLWLAALFLVTAFSAVPSAAQDAEQKRKALGSRVGDREQDANNAGLSGDRRTSKRLDTRIDGRLNTRIERFSDPQADYYTNSITPKTDDGTKRP